MDNDISHAVQDELDALAARIDKLEVAAGLAIATDIGEGPSQGEPKEEELYDVTATTTKSRSKS